MSLSLSALQQRMWRWIDSRRPPAKQQNLSRNNLYIFPSWQGLWFLVADIILWLVGTNYENNLILAMAFLLITLFVITILHTFANLSGLSIQLLSVKPVFSGETAEVKILVTRNGKRGRRCGTRLCKRYPCRRRGPQHVAGHLPNQRG